jgi:hypothetical protein
METEGSYNALEKSIAPSHLQIVEIICKDVDGIVLKVLKVLNANGIPLGKIRIQCSGCKLSICTVMILLCSCPYVLQNQVSSVIKLCLF